MIDTHCHLTYTPLLDQVDAVLARAAEAGVDRMISVGTSPADALVALGLAKRFDHVYGTVGVHPHYADQCADRSEVVQVMQQLAADPKVVALGEMGLDKHYSDPPMADQRRVFAWQLEVAQGLAKPIVIHNREATDDVLAMIRDSGIDGKRFVFHCFTGSDHELDAILELGAMVSFTGIVTFNSAKSLADCAARVPGGSTDDRNGFTVSNTRTLHRKVRPNEPCYVPWVAKFLAQKRDLYEEKFVSLDGRECGQRFFGLSVTGVAVNRNTVLAAGLGPRSNPTITRPV